LEFVKKNRSRHQSKNHTTSLELIKINLQSISAQMHTVAKYFANSGIIGPDKPDRLIIDDCDSMRIKHMPVFTTNESNAYYALLFQELP
jgi:hypothetical protein